MNRSALRGGAANAIASGLLIFVGCLVTMSAPAPPPYKITAIKAMLFYDTDGTFSPDVLTTPNFSLWNTIIGEGGAGSPSNSTFVQVEVSGEPQRDTAGPHRQLIFAAMAGGRALLRRTSDIGLFSKDGKFYAGYWLYDTGCQPVQISVRIAGQTKPSIMSAKIPFACGE